MWAEGLPQPLLQKHRLHPAVTSFFYILQSSPCLCCRPGQGDLGPGESYRPAEVPPRRSFNPLPHLYKLGTLRAKRTDLPPQLPTGTERGSQRQKRVARGHPQPLRVPQLRCPLEQPPRLANRLRAAHGEPLGWTLQFPCPWRWRLLLNPEGMRGEEVALDARVRGFSTFRMNLQSGQRRRPACASAAPCRKAAHPWRPALKHEAAALLKEGRGAGVGRRRSAPCPLSRRTGYI